MVVELGRKCHGTSKRSDCFVLRLCLFVVLGNMTNKKEKQRNGKNQDDTQNFGVNYHPASLEML